MNVSETLSDGLKRELSVVIPASDIRTRLDGYLEELKGKVRINGFRPGKVPTTHLRRLYGKAAMAEIVNTMVGDTVRQTVSERGEKPALQPAIELGEDKLDAVLDGGSDLTFAIRYEVLPEFEVADVAGVTVTQPVAEVADAEIDAELERIAANLRSYSPRAEGEGAEMGDKVTFDFVGKIDGEAFENGSAEGADLVLGSNSFIPGFEEQMVGVVPGESRTLEVTFPTEYAAAHLAGKSATFDIQVSAVASPDAIVLDDTFAERVGLKSIDEVRDAVRGRMESETGAASRQKTKRSLLDAIDGQYDFPLPQSLVDSEFETIWRQLLAEMARTGRRFEDDDTTAAEAEAEYRRIAARRVRLGLVLSKIGEAEQVEVSDEELQAALRDRIRQFPGQEREVFEFYKKNPNAVASLRGPLFEDKVVDILLGRVQVDRQVVDRATLLADDAEEDKPAVEG